MYEELKKINTRPRPFQFYTAEFLWDDDHISKQMLKYHLSEDTELASRKTTFIEQAVAWSTARFKIDKDTRIADFGCGPGLYATRWAEKGASVTGIDFSARSLRHARKVAGEKGLDIDFVQKNYLEFVTDKKFNLITMIYYDFCALSRDQRREMLRKFHDSLDDRGMVLLDVLSLNAFELREETATYGHLLLDGFWSTEDYYCFLNTFRYDREKVILDKYTIFDKSGKREVYNWLQYFSRESVERELKAEGLKIIEYYSNVAGAPYSNDSTEFAIVAKKV